MACNVGGFLRQGSCVNDAEVYAEVRADLMRYATALVGVADAADPVSNVVTRVLEHPGGLSALDDPKPYLMKAVLNEARMRHRPNNSSETGRCCSRWRPRRT